MRLFDPTSPPSPRAASLAPRPAALQGLRLGLVENTKINSLGLLTRVAERLARRYGMAVTHVDRKRSPSHGVSEEAVALFRRRADTVVSGIGD